MNTTFKPWVLAFSRFSIVLMTLLVCAANVTNSLLLKWGLRDGQDDFAHSFSLYGMMNGLAPKPYVYRSAFPQVVKWIVNRLGPDIQAALYKPILQHDLLRPQYFIGVPGKYWTPVVALTYYATYFTMVGAMILTLWLIFRLARSHALTLAQSLGVVVAFSFLYPLTFQQGGYYYDFIELLGVFLACYCFLNRWMVACTLCIALFSFNKETFFLVPLALFFLYERDVPLRARVGWLAVQLACCLASRHVIMGGYGANAGGVVVFLLYDNLRYWADPKTYFTFYNLVGKGIPMPGIENPLILIPLVVFLHAGWRQTNVRYRRYFHAAFWPLAVLFVFFGFHDEVRVFSLAFPALVLIALNGVGRFGAIFSDTAAVSVKIPSQLISSTVLEAQREN